MKNKIAAIILASVLAFAMTACGDNAQKDTAQASASEASAVSQASSASQTSSKSEAETASSQSSAAEAAPEAETETLEKAEEDEAAEAAEPEIPVVDEDLAPLDCVTLGNYKNLVVNDTYADPTDEDVDSYITSLLSPTYVEDENAVVASGDTANIDYEGKIDGVAFEGGTSQGYDLVIGSGTFIPGFEDGVIGMKVGETKDIDVTFPEDYHNEEYAGKAAVFTVKLNNIKRAPELDGEWVETFSNGELKTVEEFREFVRNSLATSLKRQAESAMQYEAWQQVVDSSTVTKLPKSYVDRSGENFDRINMADAEEYGMTFEEFLESNNITDEYYQQLKDAYAIDSAKNTILCYAVWESEGMTAEDPEYKESVQEVADTLGMTMEELKEEYGEETIDNYGKTYGVLKRVLSYATVNKAADSTSEG